MKSVKVLLILVLIFFGISAVNAEIYTWTDKNGVRHYGDSPPEDAKDAKVVFPEYQFDESADKKRTQQEEEQLKSLIQEIEEEDAADQAAREVDEAQAPAQGEEFQVTLAGVPQARFLLDRALLPQAFGDVHAGREPGGVEHREVVGVDGGTVAPAQGVAGQEHGEGAAAFLQFAGAGDDRLQGLVLAPIGIHGLQAGGAAGGLVRLRQHPHGQSQGVGQHGDTPAAVLCRTLCDCRGGSGNAGRGGPGPPPSAGAWSTMAGIRFFRLMPSGGRGRPGRI